ncbi:MAG: hypothetical protein ABIQ93_03135 [Saprospiraceae bacterium]
MLIKVYLIVPDLTNRHSALLLHYLPAAALRIPLPEILQLLEVRFAEALYPAFDPTVNIPGPAALYDNTEWIKTANTVGVNIRTIQNFWNLIPYVLTLPMAQNAIHLLPIWEPGVVSSLYGPVSWNINPAFFSSELAAAFPQLDTVEKQLKVVVNLLHLLGRTVGMDVVPHTDRYSEMALANPQYFEWLQRDNLQIVRHDSRVYETAQALLLDFVREKKSAVPGSVLPETARQFFEELQESDRLQILFGPVADYAGRLERRKAMVSMLYVAGLETVPATMGPPYRGLEVDPDPEAKVVDEDGRVWRDYRITRPQAFSRVFGPLARYKLYESCDDNQDWALDFERPNRAAWDYVSEHYRQIQAAYDFDFMRGDMSHVQMRPGGVPSQPGDYYDLLAAVKRTVLPEKPYFGYFAESFLAPPGEMAYGDEPDHLEASLADSTLGDLQSEPVGTERFIQTFRLYRDWLETRRFAPNFTVMTADKDDPRFDRFYLRGNEIRHFIALFLTDMPSYMALGFECRDPHPVPAPNEHYTKLYVFSMPNGDKGTTGPYQWGQNEALYNRLVRQKQLAEAIFPAIAGEPVQWLLRPDERGQQKIIAWTQAANPRFVFVANLDTENARVEVVVPVPPGNWQQQFSTAKEQLDEEMEMSGRLLIRLLPGEGLVFWEN